MTPSPVILGDLIGIVEIEILHKKRFTEAAAALNPNNQPVPKISSPDDLFASVRQPEAEHIPGMKTALRIITKDLRNEYSKGFWYQDVVQARLNATGAGAVLVKGYTRDTIPQYLMDDVDLFFVDGGHSEETIEFDGRFVLQNMTGAGVAVFDDFYVPPVEGVGCNKFIRSLAGGDWDVTILPVETHVNGHTIAMVKVRKRADLHLQRQEAHEAGTARNDGEPGHYVRTMWQPYAPPTASD